MARTKSRHARVRRGRATIVRALLTRRGRRVRGAVVRVRGPGFKRSAKTGRRGRVKFRVRARRNGRATVSTGVCGGKLRVRASAERRRGGARFTG